MSEHKASSTQLAGAAPADHAGQTGSQGTSSEISHLLTTITGLMAESERRQTAALQDMQARINSLATSTNSATNNVPDEFKGAFRQIEEAMSQLAGRITAVPASPPMDQDSAKLAETPDLDGLTAGENEDSATVPNRHQDALLALTQMLARPTTVAESKLEEEHDASPIEETGEPEMVEAVAPQGQQTDNITEPAADGATAPEQPLLVDGNPDDPWDEIAAEQLTRLYETGDAGLPAFRDVAMELHSVLPQVIEEKPEPAPSAHLPDEDLAWLTEQFAEIKQALASRENQFGAQDQAWLADHFSRIATSLEEVLSKPDATADALDAIDTRFDAFESRFAEAVNEFNSENNASNLKEIEACIIEFSSQLEKSQIELDKLGRLESEIQDLAERLSEERILAMLEPAPAPAPRNDINPEQIAEFVARHVAERSARKVAEVLPTQSDNGAATAEALSGIKGLINNLIIEHRNEGKQTTDRLETMQTSMTRLLDRVEQIETTQQKAPSAPAPAAPVAPAAQVASAAAQRQAPEASRPQPETELPQTLAAADAASALPSQGSAARRDLVRDSAPAPTQDQAMQRRAEAAVDRRPAAEPPEDHQVAAKNFMADARRAAAQANARMQRQDQASAGAQSEPSLDAAAQAQRDDQYEDEDRVASRPSRARLAIAAVAVIAIGLGASNLLWGWVDGAGKPAVSATNASGAAKPANAEGTPAPSQPARAKPKGNDESSLGAQPKATANLNDTGLPAGVALTPAAEKIYKDRLESYQKAQETAALSTKIGASQPVASAMPASLIPSQPSVNGKSSLGRAGTLNRDLPPALIGPLSLRLAAGNGNPSAAFEVGARFAEGKGVRQDFREAAKWYGRSASKGFALAQYRLATLYERGLGVDQDLSRAKIWYERAARQGNVKAMHNLAVVLAGGKAGATDYGSAARWFTEAADRGLADSQFNLAILHENGLGVSKDLKSAYKWFALAARAGDKDADQRRQALTSQLDPASLAAAKTSVTGWRRRAVSRIANDARFAGTQWKNETTSPSRS